MTALEHDAAYHERYENEHGTTCPDCREYEVPDCDTVCTCNHWYEEHDGPCVAPDCTCKHFTPSAELSSPEAIADRGGDPDLWPEHVKRALTQEA